MGRQRTLDVEPTPDLGVAPMALAMRLAEKAAEWGGDARDTLAKVAQLGLAMLMQNDSR